MKALFVENMTTKDVRSYFLSKKAEKKDSQVQVPQLVKISDNFTAAINTELKNSCKEKKKYQIDLPSKVKEEVGKHAHIYRTQAAIVRFR